MPNSICLCRHRAHMDSAPRSSYEISGSGCIVRTDVACPSEDIGSAFDRILKERPGKDAEVQLIRLMGSNYGRCLAGEAGAVQLLFGDRTRVNFWPGPTARLSSTRSYSSS